MDRLGKLHLEVFRLCLSIVLALATQSALSQYEPDGPVTAARSKAALIYNRLTGQKIPLDSQILKDMEALISEGKALEAAHMATEQATFYSQTLRFLGDRLSTRAAIYRVPMNDLTATIIGFAKDDLDARGLLTSNSLYRFTGLVGVPNAVVNDILKSNAHYAFVDTQLAANPNLDLRPTLTAVRQQIANDADAAVNHPDAAGILTSRQFLSDCADAGTNRRCYEKVVKLLTCHSLEEVANSDLPDDYIGRDVSRAPGGDPSTFQNTCKSCHSNMDAQRMAFAYTEFDEGQVKHGQINGGGLFDATTKVAVKLNRNGDGNYITYRVLNDNWYNFAVNGSFQSIYGWRDASGRAITQPISSSGLNAYGTMLGRSEAFSRCMTQNVFENICRRPVSASEKTGVIRSLASSWESPSQGNYKLRWLFEKISTTPECLGQ